MKVGFSSICITPPIGTQMMGYSPRTEGCAGVFDDLYAQAVALESEGERLVLVAIDVSALDRRSVAQLHAACADLVSPDRLWLNTSHTHAGPIVSDRPTLKPDPTYMESLARNIRAAVVQALATMVPAELACGDAPVALGESRRLPDGKGGIRMAPNPDGAALPVMTVWQINRQGADDLVLFSTPQHGVTMGGKNQYISAEWMGLARRDIARAVPGTTAVFLQGCCGDQNPRRERGTYEQVVDNARIAADAALAARANATPVASDRLAVRHEHVAVTTADGRPWTIAVQAARVGSALLLSYAGETFVEYALHGRRISAAESTVVLGYTQGSEGYICTEAVYSEGGYEVTANSVFPVGAAFAPTVESLLHAAAERLVAELVFARA